MGDEMGTSIGRRVAHWAIWLISLSITLALAGCAGLSGDSDDYDTPEPPGPKAHEYSKQAEAMAEQGLWLEAAALSDKAAARAAWSRSGKPEDGSYYYYVARSADFLQKAGDLGQAQARWQQAADIAIRYAASVKSKESKDASSLITRSNSLNSAADYLSKLGQTGQAKALWKEAADIEGQRVIIYRQEFDKTRPELRNSQRSLVGSSLLRQARFLYKAGEAEAAVAVLQNSGLEWALHDWDAPRKPDDSVPTLLPSMEALLGEALLGIDKGRADAVFTRLWQRRDHPYVIQIGGGALWEAAEALNKAGDREFAGRMYLAAARTQFLDFAASSNQAADAFPFVERLRAVGFDRDAVEVEKRFNEARVLHASAMVKAAKQRAEKFSQENQLELARLYVQGYEYFGNQRLADSFKREEARWEYGIQKSAQEKAAYERNHQARMAAIQAKKEEGSGFMTFINALSSGLEAYARSRNQGVSAGASNSAALSAAARSAGSGSGDSMLGATLAAAAGATQQYQAGSAASVQQGSAAASGGAARQRKTVRNATHCVTRDRQTNSLADYLGNTCDFPITVKWFALNDSTTRHCAMGTGGCSDSLNARQARSSVYKLKGTLVHAACEGSTPPKNPDGGPWTGSGQHICVSN